MTPDLAMPSVDTLREAFANAVYFHAIGGPLTHNAGCLAEGAMDLEIPIKLCGPQLTSRPVSMPFKGDDLTPLVTKPSAGFAGYIVDISHTNQFTPFGGIADGRLAYLNQSDTAAFARIPDEHLLFVTHENDFASKGGRRHPIAFGLSKGLIAATGAPAGVSDSPPRRPAQFPRHLEPGCAGRARLDLRARTHPSHARGPQHAGA
ncbi:MAG: hypothetical protein EXQ84_01575 [Rhodospirillaceae bacterium]|nr:hypothetical protein [Rhodospirillaceae bacterium]